MTPNALAMVDQVVAGFEDYPHYFAIEKYYTTGNTGPNVVIYLSKETPILAGPQAVSIGSGLRVECYTTTGANLGVSRMSVGTVSAGVVTWGVQELVVGDCRPTLIGGVPYDVPASYVRQNNQADMAGAVAAAVMVLLGVFVIVALYWRVFRLRG